VEALLAKSLLHVHALFIRRDVAGVLECATSGTGYVRVLWCIPARADHMARFRRSRDSIDSIGARSNDVVVNEVYLIKHLLPNFA
jgi:hypothetical protein